MSTFRGADHLPTALLRPGSLLRTANRSPESLTDLERRTEWREFTMHDCLEIAGDSLRTLERNPGGDRHAFGK
jgi:hypothetical protein